MKKVNNNLLKTLHRSKKIEPGIKDKNVKSSEFDKILKEKKTHMTLSKHASDRIRERSVDMDPDEYLKLSMASKKLKNKGSKDSLVITDKGAYIIDVDNNKVVTALNKQDLKNNIFTKIDSTFFVS